MNRFRARHPGVAIIVEAGGSARGVADALHVSRNQLNIHVIDRAPVAVPTRNA